jgi:hypothetical protein
VDLVVENGFWAHEEGGEERRIFVQPWRMPVGLQFDAKSKSWSDHNIVVKRDTTVHLSILFCHHLRPPHVWFGQMEHARIPYATFPTRRELISAVLFIVAIFGVFLLLWSYLESMEHSIEIARRNNMFYIDSSKPPI